MTLDFSGIVVEGKLAHAVIADDCTWSIDASHHIAVITLVKGQSLLHKQG